GICEAVEPHRRAARGDHARDDPEDAAPLPGHHARGEQRAHQRKRQCEYRVADANKRSVGAEAVEHQAAGSSRRPIAAADTPLTKYSSTSSLRVPMPGGSVTVANLARRPLLMLPKCWPNPRASAPIRVADSRS